MKCPKCEIGKTKVITSRSIYEATYRQRQCSKCGYEFYTEEIEIDNHDGLKAIWAANAARARLRRTKLKEGQHNGKSN